MLSAALIAQLSQTASSPNTLPLARGATFHSGRVRPGDVFFAMPGEATHGIHYADAALAAGAAFIVSDRPHPRGIVVPDPSESLLALGRYARVQQRGPVISVTGSAGKTSSKAFIAAALAAKASPGNFNTPWALACTLIDHTLKGNTAETDILILELGIDHQGEMAQLTNLTNPTHGLLTLIDAAHLHELKTLEQVAAEKGVLLEHATHAWASHSAYLQLSPELQAKTRSYGLVGEGAHVQGRILAADRNGQTLEVFDQRVTLPYLGPAMAQNAIGALALAEQLGIDLCAAAERLAEAVLEPHRLQVHKRPAFTVIDDCYNSNPASASAALTVLKDFPTPHTIIFGDMLELGQDSARFHHDLGEQTQGFEHVIAIGPESRALCEGNPKAQHFAERDAAAVYLENLLSTNALHGTVLVKASRGMRLEALVELLLNHQPTIPTSVTSSTTPPVAHHQGGL